MFSVKIFSNDSQKNVVNFASAENQNVSSYIALDSGRSLYCDMKQSFHQMTIFCIFLALKVVP